MRYYCIAAVGVLVWCDSVVGFHAPVSFSPRMSHQLAAKRHVIVVKEGRTFDPLGFADSNHDLHDVSSTRISTSVLGRRNTVAASSVLASAAGWSVAAEQASANSIDLRSFNTGNLTPETFQPVCSTSDGFYRILQSTAQNLVGQEKFVEYGPLIASGLLRIRLELCVVESFFNEAVGPFIRDNGLSWVLPLHETVETFLAGAIFATATTFILIGSTKLVTVIVTYTDFLLGLPSRLIGGFAFDRAQGKPVTLDIGFGPFKTRLIGPADPKEGEKVEFKFFEASIPTMLVLILSGALNVFGKVLELIRELLEALDTFVGRYLVLWASFYLVVKFLHFKVFPDFPPF